MLVMTTTSAGRIGRLKTTQVFFIFLHYLSTLLMCSEETGTDRQEEEEPQQVPSPSPPPPPTPNRPPTQPPTRHTKCHPTPG